MTTVRGLEYFGSAMKEVRQRAYRLRAFRVQEQAEEKALVSALDSSLKQGDAVIFAEALGISKQYLTDIRKGNRGISSDLLDRLCEVSA